MLKKYGIALICVATFLLGGCSNEETTEFVRPNQDGVSGEASTFIYNAIPEDASAAISPEYSKAINQFAINFLTAAYKRVETPGTNLVLSPYSIHRNLSVLTEGASSNTRKELIEALGGEVALEDAKSALSKLLYSDKTVRFNCADALWFDADSIALKESYQKIVKEKYGVHTAALSFANMPAVIETINKWVSQNTEHKIPKMLSDTDFPDATLLVLANAIYFKADWASPFNILSTKQDFFYTGTDSVLTSMMYSNYSHDIYKTDTYENVRLNYGTNSKDFFYLDIYMPTTISVETFLEEYALNAISETKEMRMGELYMPKFFIWSSLKCKPILQEIGIHDAFDSLKSRIDGIAENRNLYVSTVIHKAGIKTDEEGTEAYAATVTGCGTSVDGGGDTVTLNRPFVFFIRAGGTGLTLFSGVVHNPSK